LTCVKEGLIEDFYYGVSLYTLADGRDCREDGVFLLKPHGSLNLSFCTGHAEGTFFHYSEKASAAEIVRGERRTCPIQQYGMYGHPVVPLIIPPLYMKESYAKESKRMAVHESKRGRRLLDGGVIEWYRRYVDLCIDDVLQNADEITVVGYSMPAYDFDFKSLLIKGLMGNKNRANVPVNIITRGDRVQLDDLEQRFRHLAGPVRFIGENGFLDYIRSGRL
jgi:hypothetical protein